MSLILEGPLLEVSLCILMHFMSGGGTNMGTMIISMHFQQKLPPLPQFLFHHM